MSSCRLICLFLLLPVIPNRAHPDDRVREPVDWHIGRRLDQELNRPVNIILKRTTPRAVVERLRGLHHVALLLDRRIDPDQTIDVQFVQMTLHEALQLFAAQLDGDLARIGGTLFIGPIASTDRIRTLIALRTAELQNLERSDNGSHFHLVQGASFQWPLLTRPSRLTSDVLVHFGVKGGGEREVPHDLWGDGVMADVNLPEALCLLLGQFDLTFVWEDPTRIAVIDAPAAVSVQQSHTPRGMTAAAAQEVIQSEWPHLEPQVSGREVTLNATAREHDAIAALIAPVREDPADPVPSQGPLANRRFTLATTRAEAIAILRTLQTQDVIVQYDADELAAAGIDLRQKVTITLQQATAEEFFTQICEPLGLTFAIDGKTVTFSPKQ